MPAKLWKKAMLMICILQSAFCLISPIEDETDSADTSRVSGLPFSQNLKTKVLLFNQHTYFQLYLSPIQSIYTMRLGLGLLVHLHWLHWNHIEPVLYGGCKNSRQNYILFKEIKCVYPLFFNHSFTCTVCHSCFLTLYTLYSSRLIDKQVSLS